MLELKSTVLTQALLTNPIPRSLLWGGFIAAKWILFNTGAAAGMGDKDLVDPLDG